MKVKRIFLIKWGVVLCLFLLTIISGYFLYNQLKDQTTKTDFPTSQIKALESKKDTLTQKSEKLDKELKTIDVKIHENDSLLKTEIADTVSIQIKAENAILAENTKKNIKLINDYKKSIQKIDDDIKKIKAHKPQASIQDKANKLSISFVFWGITTFILFTLTIIALVLFSGVLKFFKSKKMDQSKECQTPVEKSEEKIIIQETHFHLPNPEIEYEISLTDNNLKCKVTINCNRQDATIKYCISPNTQEIFTYTDPIEIGEKCDLLVKAICNDAESKQITISVNPDTAKSEFSRNDTAVIEEREKEPAEATPISSPIEVHDSTEPEKGKPNATRLFTNEPNVIGISYQGDNHVKQSPAIPCQDFHSFKKVNNIWSIAVVSDGAGSKENSHIGSSAVCAAFTFYISQLLTNDKRFSNGDIPQEKIWDLEFRSLLTKFQMDLKTKEQFKPYSFESLAATIIILAYSPKGYLFAHVGDGRAGVKIGGKWMTILTPHKGEEANQTIFSTTIEFIKKPTLMMSGVFVPETLVSQETIEAFVLMSDGCEDGAWVTYQRENLPDGDFVVRDVNQPRDSVLDTLLEIVNSPQINKEASLVNFITTYNKGFVNEGDDKTILIGNAK